MLSTQSYWLCRASDFSHAPEGAGFNSLYMWWLLTIKQQTKFGQHCSLIKAATQHARSHNSMSWDGRRQVKTAASEREREREKKKGSGENILLHLRRVSCEVRRHGHAWRRRDVHVGPATNLATNSSPAPCAGGGMSSAPHSSPRQQWGAVREGAANQNVAANLSLHMCVHVCVFAKLNHVCYSLFKRCLHTSGSSFCSCLHWGTGNRKKNTNV